MLSEGPSVSCSSLQDNYAEVEQARGWRGAAAHLELKDLHIWYIQYLLKVTATLPFGWRPGAPRIAQRIKIHSCIFFFEGKAKITLSAEPRLSSYPTWEQGHCTETMTFLQAIPPPAPHSQQLQTLLLQMEA